MRTDRLAGVVLASAIALAPAQASAFCRTTTIPPAPDAPSGCNTGGLPLYQSRTCLPYRFLAKESPIIPNAVLSDAMARAFATWTAPNAHCTPGIAPIELGPVDDTVVRSYHSGERDRNVIGVVPVWPHRGGADTLALTTVTFNPETGEIYDADLEINGEVTWSFTETPPPDGYDLLSDLTHEAGHMLGFAHSTVNTAAMYPNYVPGSIHERSLDDDDEQAVCFVYPNHTQRMAPTGLVPASACELVTGDPGQPCSDPSITHGCASAPVGPGGAGGVLAAGALALVRLVRGRRR